MKKYLSFLKTLSCVMLIIFLNSCSKKAVNFDRLDPNINKNYQQLYNELVPTKENAPIAQEEEQIMPAILPMLAEPEMPELGKDKLVSISITDDVPLKDVLIELSRLADVDIEIDPSITGGVILRAKNKPFSEVIDRVCNLANLRYKNKNGVLSIERDMPYLVNYHLDFLNLIRSNSSTSSVSTSLSASGGGSSSSGSSGGGSSGSSNQITTSHEGDIWKSINNDISRLVGSSAASTDSAPVAPSSTPAAATSLTTGLAALTGLGAPTANASTTKSSASNDTNNHNYVTINKEAGILNVLATNKQHHQVLNYLEKVKTSVASQVLIEAKVIEVSLNDKYKTGINWSEFNSQVLKYMPATGSVNSFVNSKVLNFPSSIDLSTDGGIATISGALSTKNLSTVVQLLQNYGNTRTLASPRINAMNNQQAVLSFVENKVYFLLKVDYTPSTTTGTTTTTASTTVNSTLNTIPIGVILSLQPSIDLENDSVTMNIRPTITRLSTDAPVQDPAVAFITQQVPSLNLSSTVPQVVIRELDSILKIKSGQIMVIGGMMENTSSNIDVGIPGAMKLPIIGNLFKSVNKANTVTQTVIFIKATIIRDDTMSKRDKKFYNNYAVDEEVNI